jgi:hypothetical protein
MDMTVPYQIDRACFAVPAAQEQLLDRTVPYQIDRSCIAVPAAQVQIINGQFLDRKTEHIGSKRICKLGLFAGTWMKLRICHHTSAFSPTVVGGGKSQ